MISAFQTTKATQNRINKRLSKKLFDKFENTFLPKLQRLIKKLIEAQIPKNQNVEFIFKLNESKLISSIDDFSKSIFGYLFLTVRVHQQNDKFETITEAGSKYSIFDD